MIGTTIGRYTITSRLVSGPFGETWLAHDASLDRTVALKLLPSSLAQDQTTRARFMEEVRAAGAIEHPNIASVHDSGELADGRLWVAMRWSGGQSLGEREKEGPLSVEEAVDIAIQAGRGLLKAHQAGLVLCDASPESIVVSKDGHAEILPCFQGAEAAERSDTSALQALLSEMLGKGAHVPVELQKIIDGRYRGMAETVGELEWLAGKVSSGTLPRGTGVPVPGARRRRRTLVAALSAVVLIGAALGGYLLWKANSATPTAAERVTIVLLPIANGVGTSAEDMLGDVMTDGLMTDLTKIRALRVISQNSARLIKADESIALVGKKLGADYVLKGSAGRDGEKVLLALELWHVTTEEKDWEKVFTKPRAETVALQAQGAKEAAGRAGVEVTAEDRKRLVERKVVKPEANELYVKARKLSDTSGNVEELTKAVEYLLQAVDMEPQWAAAWAALASAYFRLSALDIGLKQKEGQAMQRARELDPASVEVQLALADTEFGNGRFAEALVASAAAVAADPSSSQAHSSYSGNLGIFKRFSEAMAEAKEAVRLDPLSKLAITNLLGAYELLRDFSGSVGVARELLEMFPNDEWMYLIYGYNLIEAGRYDEGIRYLEKSIEMGLFWGGEGLLGWGLAMKGDLTAARAIAKRLARNWDPKMGNFPAMYVAQIYANTHDEKLAMEWLKKASEVAPIGGWGLNTGLPWDPLRSIPEFVEIIRSLGLPE